MNESMNWLVLIESLLLVSLVWNNELNSIASRTTPLAFAIFYVLHGLLLSVKSIWISITFRWYYALSNNESISHTPTIEYTHLQALD